MSSDRDTDPSSSHLTMPDTTVSDANNATRQANEEEEDNNEIQRLPTRPAMSSRVYSTHIYASTMQQSRDFETGLTAPERVHIPQQHPDTLPAQAIVTIRPRAPPRANSGLSDASSGISANEVTVPEYILDDLEAHGPGTYRMNLQDSSQTDVSSDDNDGASLQKAPTVDYALHQLNDFTDKIASEEDMEALVKANPLPDATGWKLWNDFRHDFFSAYRRLHVLVLIGNLIALCICISKSIKGVGPPHQIISTAVGANIFASTLMRHEHLVNFIFRFCVALPHSFPVRLRRYAAKVYSYGGIHSACGISALAWYVYWSVLLYDQPWGMTKEMDVAKILCCAMLFLLGTLIIMSYPGLRSKFHNQWELVHRYFGWTSIGIIWAQVMLISVSDARLYNLNLGRALYTSPTFWFLIGITVLIIYPWLRLRRVKFEAEQLSDRAIRLWFSERSVPSTVGIKLSTSPLLENHSFATIPNADGDKGYSVLVARAGDWTKKLINDPPKYLWARGAYTIGVMRVALLFKSIVVVTTGSGIGPCLSFLQAHPGWPCHVVWSAPFPEASFGDKVMNAVFKADNKALVIDTKKTGKPNLVDIAYAMYKKTDAEAVIIISNPAATKEVVYNLETRKVPAFGAIFDS